MLRDCLDEIKGRIAVASRKNPAEIGITNSILREQHGPVLTGDELRAQDRLESMLARDIEKADRAVEPVCIRKGEKVLSLLFDCLTEGLQRGHAPHR